MEQLYLQSKNGGQPRTTRRFERKLSKIIGIGSVDVASSGIIRLSWDPEQTDHASIIKAVKEAGLKEIDHPDDLQSATTEQEGVPLSLQFLGEKTELYFAAISGCLWAAGLIFTYLVKVNEVIPMILFIAGAFFGGFFTFITAGRDLLQGRFEIDFLMLFAAVGAAALGKWGEGALLLFLFSLGHALEHYAMKRARRSIAALSDLAPTLTLVKRAGKITEVNVDQLETGDIVVIKPNSKITADGVVSGGNSAVNQAPITGESVPVDKYALSAWESQKDINKIAPQHRVFAGTINGNGVLEVMVMRKAKDTTLARLITLVQEAETQKSPTQHLADNFERYYVPGVLVVVTILLGAFLVIDETFQQSFYRAMSVLIAASPCALAISTPSAVLAGIARAARQGVLIKGGRPLEDLGKVSALAFDKTGTITEGRPTLTHVIPFGSTDRTDLLSVAVAVEGLSDHPLAAAIVKGARQEIGNISIEPATKIKALTARGVSAVWGNETVHIGNRRLMREITGNEIPPKMEKAMGELEAKGETVMIVHRGTSFLGLIAVMDVARPEAAATLSTLKKMGIKRMVMLTGDNQKVANAIAEAVGITEAFGSLLPEKKVAAIERLRTEEGIVAMIGDGVNDAPAMARSTVGIAMGAAGSDVALETADIALMADKLDNLPFAIGLSRKARQIIKQNLIISLGMVAVLVPLTIMGAVAIGPAVVGHEGSTIVVVLNALRLLKFKH